MLKTVGVSLPVVVLIVWVIYMVATVSAYAYSSPASGVGFTSSRSHS